MLTVYIICAVIGGGLMLLSAIGGLMHGGLDVDHSLDVDHGFDVGHDLDLAGGGGIDFDHDLSVTEAASELPHVDINLSSGFGAHDFWLAFVSMRFITYFSGTFGVLGLALHYFSSMPEALIPFVSALVALGVGYSGSLLFRYLKAEGVTSGVTKHDYVGVLGRTLVAIRESQPGKVRIRIKNDTLDMIALSEGGKEIAKGEEIVVVGLEGDKVRVMPRGELTD